MIESNTNPLIVNEINTSYKYYISWPKQYPHIHKILFYPFNNIYPYHIHFKFDGQKIQEKDLYKYNDSDRLFLAVLWLQGKRVKDVLKGTTNYNILWSNLNPLEMLCKNICGKDYYYKDNYFAFMWIAEMLVKFNPDWATSDCFESLYRENNWNLINFLRDYVRESDNECYVCLNKEPVCEALYNVCSCKMPVHISCLKNEELRENPICKICNSNYKINEGDGFRIFFPFDDFYYVPLWRDLPIRKVTSTDRIKYAYGYAQPQRLINLFETLSEDEILSYFKSDDYQRITQQEITSLDNTHSHPNYPYFKYQCDTIMADAAKRYCTNTQIL